MDRGEYELRWRRAHSLERGAGGPLVGAWLVVVRRLAEPVARAGVPPAALTVAGLVAACLAVPAALAGGRWAVLVAVLVAACALADGLDGAVALLTGRAGRWGAVLDAGTDRLSEAAFAVALWALGAPGWAAAAAVGIAWWHEYLRERAATVGTGAPVVVTVAERPTRVAVVAMFALAAGVLPGGAAAWSTAGVVVWGGTGLVGLIQLVRAWRRLR